MINRTERKNLIPYSPQGLYKTSTNLVRTMTTNHAPFGGISKNVLALLFIWFFIFAVGDFATTFWLILHDPAGIANEGNPFAASLYSGGGFIPLIFAKIGICLLLELTFIFFGSKYSHISWFRGTLEAIILFFTGYSLIIIYNNFLCILTIQASLAPNFLKDLSITETGMLILALIFNYLFLYFSKARQILIYVEASIATIIFLGPLILWRSFFHWYLKEQPFFYFAYLGSVLTILAIAFYITGEIAKERRLKASGIK